MPVNATTVRETDVIICNADWYVGNVTAIVTVPVYETPDLVATSPVSDTSIALDPDVMIYTVLESELIVFCTLSQNNASVEDRICRRSFLEPNVCPKIASYFIKSFPQNQIT